MVVHGCRLVASGRGSAVRVRPSAASWSVRLRSPKRVNPGSKCLLPREAGRSLAVVWAGDSQEGSMQYSLSRTGSAVCRGLGAVVPLVLLAFLYARFSPGPRRLSAVGFDGCP